MGTWAPSAWNEDAFQILEALAQLPRIAHADGIAFPTFHGVGKILTPNGNLDDVLHIADVDAVAGEHFPIGFELDVGPADNPVGNDVRGAGHFAQNLLHLQADLFDLLGIRAKDLDTHHGPEAGLQHDDPRLDWLQPGRKHSRNRGFFLEFRKKLCLGNAPIFRPERIAPAQPADAAVPAFHAHLAPLAFRSEGNDRFDHAGGGRVESGFGAPDLADHVLDFRYRADGPVLFGDDLLTLRQRRGRQQRRHVQERAFVERRHELSADAWEHAFQFFPRSCLAWIGSNGLETGFHRIGQLAEAQPNEQPQKNQANGDGKKGCLVVQSPA